MASSPAQPLPAQQDRLLMAVLATPRTAKLLGRWRVRLQRSAPDGTIGPDTSDVLAITSSDVSAVLEGPVEWSEGPPEAERGRYAWVVALQLAPAQPTAASLLDVPREPAKFYAGIVLTADPGQTIVQADVAVGIAADVAAVSNWMREYLTPVGLAGAAAALT